MNSRPDQDESKVGTLAKHPGVGGEHEVGGQTLKSLTPRLHSTVLTDIPLKTENENKEREVENKCKTGRYLEVES